MRLIYVLPFLITQPALACMSSPEENFKNWDNNNDGVVTWEEHSPPDPRYNKMTDAYKKREDDYIKLRKENFEKIDTDKNGNIDKKEGLKLPPFQKC
jgi:Ca2+-binding EF-hand superfamily protein